MSKEFEEIGHSGGQITFNIKTDEEGQTYQVSHTSNRPVPMSLIAIYALRQGIPVESIRLGGIGQPWNPPPFSGCYPVLVASDSQGKFGHSCPQCSGYWRSGPWPNMCPYCATRAQSYQFFSEAQLCYVRHYCEVLNEALYSGEDGKVVIDMDAVADAVGKENDKPSFYVSEQSQQNKFVCKACDEFNDILGRFGYCSLCGTRNDLMDFEDHAIPVIRKRLNTDNAPEDCVRDAVALFDSFMAQIAKQLAEMVPLTVKRKNRLLSQRFHDLEKIRIQFKDWFDIDLCADMKQDERNFTALMFYRRHVYEHNGGEVDQRYLDVSGDTAVRLKQHIHETQEDAHRLLGSLVKMARNIHGTFHELLPPLSEPIEAFEERKARMLKYASGKGDSG